MTITGPSDLTTPEIAMLKFLFDKQEEHSSVDAESALADIMEQLVKREPALVERTHVGGRLHYRLSDDGFEVAQESARRGWSRCCPCGAGRRR